MMRLINALLCLIGLLFSLKLPVHYVNIANDAGGSGIAWKRRLCLFLGHCMRKSAQHHLNVDEKKRHSQVD